MVDDHDVVLAGGGGHQRVEDRAGQQFLRVGRGGAGRQNGKIDQAGDAGDGFGQFSTAGQQAGKTKLVFEAEELVLARVAQVGIDQQRTFAELREDDSQVGGGEAAAICSARADDSQRLVTDLCVKPAQHELAAHGAQLFDDGTEGFEGGDHLFANALVTGHQVGVVVLAGERLLDIGFREQAELDGGVAKAQALLFLQLEDALGGIR